MAKEVVVTASKLKKRAKLIKTLQLFTFTAFAGMFSLFTVLNFVYNGGRLSINLDRELTDKKGIVLYEDSISKQPARKLYAKDLEYMDNISINWLPTNIDSESDGAHNGDNYIAYTFFLENTGEEDIDYWYTIFIDDVIKGVDEAIRIIVYRNGERVVYAKMNADTNEPEENTKAFTSEEVAVVEKVENFKAGTTDRFTLVVFIEGDDPDCVNQIIGGEITLHMEITEEKNGG